MIEKQIYKFMVPLGTYEFTIQKGAEIISAGVQNGTLVVWAIIDPTAPLVTRRTLVVGTGHPFYPEDGNFIGTVCMGNFVWHVFDFGEADG